MLYCVYGGMQGKIMTEDEFTLMCSKMTIEEFFYWLIEQHNAKKEKLKQRIVKN